MNLMPPHETLWVLRQNRSLNFTIASCKSSAVRSLEYFPSQCPLANHGRFACTIPSTGLNINSFNKMITDFSNVRDVISARKVFNKMLERDVITWNSMMTAFVRNGCYKEVLQMFSEMQISQFKANHTTFSMVLTSCGKVGALVHGKQIHGLSIKIQSSANVFVGTSLITMYSRCGVTDCLSKVFEGIYYPNTASWNALISGFVLNCQVSRARGVFDIMPSRSVVSWTAMITGYVEVKKMRSAIELFEVMPVKNHVTWSVMLSGFINCRLFCEAHEFFLNMLSAGVRATVPSVIEVINACSCTGNLKQGCKIHCYVIKVGFHVDVMIEISLVSMYCHCLEMEEAELEFTKMEMKSIGSWNSLLCGFINSRNSSSINDARRIFDSMKSKDNFTWNSMINGYLKSKRLDDAMKLFWKMPQPTIETLTSLMYSFIKIGNLEEAQKLFNMMPAQDVVAYTTMLFGYLESGQMDNAVELFNKMPQRNVVSYNVMISGLLRHGKVEEAYKLFIMSPVRDSISWDSVVSGFVHNGLYSEAIQLYKEMVLSDIRPSELIVASLLRASAKLSILAHGEQIHGVAIKLGHESSLIVGNSKINMYGKCGNVPMARFAFEQMTDHDVVTWNAIIHIYACNGLGKEAIELLEEMKMGKIKPDDVTFLVILFACSHNCLWEEALHYFNSMICDYGIKPRVAHHACLIDLLCRIGMVEKAHELAQSMPSEPDSTVWTSILSGCRLYCSDKLAEHAAKHLLAWDPLDRMPYLHLISIYASTGRWADAECLRGKMHELTSNRSGCSWI